MTTRTITDVGGTLEGDINLRHVPTGLWLAASAIGVLPFVFGPVPALAGVAANPQMNATNACSARVRLIERSAALTASTVLIQSPRLRTPQFCKTSGKVWPNITFSMLSPTDNWNGKFVELGNFGAGGIVSEWRCNQYLRRGFACTVFDGGHKGTGFSWARNNVRAQVTYAVFAPHLVRDASIDLLSKIYSKTPALSYFIGCSTGGFEGLSEAQRYPNDFNGIVAGAPEIDEFDLASRWRWSAERLHSIAGLKEKLSLVHRFVLQECSSSDQSPIVDRPLGCTANLELLNCDRHPSSGCLTRRDISTINELYQGPEFGPTSRYPDILPGSELLWTDEDIGFAASSGWATDLFRNVSLPQGNPAERSSFTYASAPLFIASNPDLSAFAKANGKLLIYQGAYDIVERPGRILDYYRSVVEMSRSKGVTDTFVRMFLVPGMEHCAGGPGSWAVDYLKVLDDWKTSNSPPEYLSAHNIPARYLDQLSVDWNDIGIMRPGDLSEIEKRRIRSLYVEFPLAPEAAKDPAQRIFRIY